MSLSTKIFIGLFLGIATGLFLGEMVAFLKPVGDSFVQLLKMAVLPYILVALISGLGRLNYSEAKTRRLLTPCATKSPPLPRSAK